VCPHADSLHGLDIIKNLINEAMLNVDAPGECSMQIATQCLKWRGGLIRILFQDVEKLLRFGTEV
jgi:hypothetical protein